MRVKESFLNLGQFQLCSGHNIRFWEDRWLGNFTIKELYPTLFTITRKKHISITSIFSTVPLNVSFCRGLVGYNLNCWHNLVARVADTRLTDMNDKFIWGLHQKGIFSVKSMYLALISDNRVRHDFTIWKLKIPLKNKIFTWYLKRGVVLTKDNLIRRNWRGGKQSVFCAHDETIQHLFFDCHFAKFIWTTIHIAFNFQKPLSVTHLFHIWASAGGIKNWKLLLTVVAALIWALWTSRNDLVFDNSPTKTYMHVLFRGPYWLHQWAQLRRHEEDDKLLLKACGILETLVIQIFANFGWHSRNRIGSS
jgi:hypothetical protein